MDINIRYETWVIGSTVYFFSKPKSYVIIIIIKKHTLENNTIKLKRK